MEALRDQLEGKETKEDGKDAEETVEAKEATEDTKNTYFVGYTNKVKLASFHLDMNQSHCGIPYCKPGTQVCNVEFVCGYVKL